MSPLQVLLLCLLPIYGTAQQNFKVCAKHIHTEECAQINRDDNIKCSVYTHNLDCLIGISNGTSSFGMVTPYEAAIASSFLDNIKVVAEIRPGDETKESEEFKMVVLVKDRNINKFADLRGKKFCHPGYGKLTVPNYMVDMFEEAILNEILGKGCQVKNTLIEKRIEEISKFFERSCKPGPWVHDPEKDRELKKLYPNMCALCDGIPNDMCTLSSVTQPFESALDCYEKFGDVAITTTKEIHKKTNEPPGYYLCPNGKASTEECVWTRKPWPLIVANGKNVDSVVDYLKQLLYDQIVQGAEIPKRKLDVRPYLQYIFKSDSTKRYQLMNTELNEYIKGFNFVPEESRCDAELKWCLTSDEEMQKCKWFQRATRNQGILPGVGCIQKENRIECLDAIAKDKANIVTIDNNLGYTARKYGLVSIGFPETSDKVRSMVVVPNLQNNIALSNLKGKKGCFAEFGDIAYISFFKNLNTSGLVKPTCNYGLFSNEFLGESCIPGINDPDRKSTKVTDTEKLCRICRSERTSNTCKANSENVYFGNEGALKCIKENVGDFAVISNRNVSDISLNDKELIVICKNGSLALYPGLKVDDDCYLSITSSSELVVKNDFKYYNDSLIILSAFEVIFGQDLHKPFDLFGPFNGTKDLMFKDTTPGLNFNAEDNQYTNNYMELFSDFDNCIRAGYSGAVKIDVGVTQALIITTLGLITFLKKNV